MESHKSLSAGHGGHGGFNGIRYVVRLENTGHIGVGHCFLSPFPIVDGKEHDGQTPEELLLMIHGKLESIIIAYHDAGVICGVVIEPFLEKIVKA